MPVGQNVVIYMNTGMRAVWVVPMVADLGHLHFLRQYHDKRWLGAFRPFFQITFIQFISFTSTTGVSVLFFCDANSINFIKRHQDVYVKQSSKRRFFESNGTEINKWMLRTRFYWVCSKFWVKDPQNQRKSIK